MNKILLSTLQMWDYFAYPIHIHILNFLIHIKNPMIADVWTQYRKDVD